MQALARGTFWSPGEWARRTAIPIVRTECIRGYVTAADAIPPRAVGQYRRRRLARSRNELLAVLSATRSSLTRMGEPSLGLAGRQDTLEELFAHRERQRHLLAKLEKDWPTRTAARSAGRTVPGRRAGGVACAPGVQRTKIAVFCRQLLTRLA